MQHRRTRLIRRVAWLLSFCSLACAALAQTGCTTGFANWVHNGFKVGPNYHPPSAPLPPQWIDYAHPLVHIGEANLASWWDAFGDPILSKLIHQAYAQNLTLRQVGVLIQQAQVQRKIALAELLPQGQSMTGGYGHGILATRNFGVNPASGPQFGTSLAPSVVVSGLSTPSTPIGGSAAFGAGAAAAGTTTTGTSPLINSSIGAGGAGSGIPRGDERVWNDWGDSLNLSWELDFWGLYRRNLEAANANLEQSMHNCDEMVVQFLANVATQYVQIRILQRRLELARRNVALQEPLVNSLYQQFKAGIVASKPAYYQLKSNLDNTRGLIPPLEITLRASNNALCVLLGVPVHDLLPELGDGTAPDPNDPGKWAVRIPVPLDEKVVLGIPGEILLRRPDVQAMEMQLRIQNAQMGIAEAQMLPHIGINGNIGLAADRLSLLFNQQSWIGSIGPSMTWNILNYGRLLANVRVQNKIYQQYVLAYQQTILNADEDVENTLVSYLRSLEQSQHLTNSANAAVEVTKYYYDQIGEGYLPPGATSLTYYNQIFTAVNFRVTQQDLAAQAQGNIGLNLILLYRALGGGWQIKNEHNPNDGEGPCLPCGPELPTPNPEGVPPGVLPAPGPTIEELPPPRPIPQSPMTELPKLRPAPPTDPDQKKKTDLANRPTAEMVW